MLQASWSSDGEAQFHRKCWQQMVASSRQQGKLCDLETKLVKEANKTAEYHDSDSSVEQEAKRIAQLLRNSSYPVFFTGITSLYLMMVSQTDMCPFCERWPSEQSDATAIYIRERKRERCTQLGNRFGLKFTSFQYIS